MQRENLSKPTAVARLAQGRAINKGLEAIRTHLGMQIAYVSEFTGECSVFARWMLPASRGRSSLATASRWMTSSAGISSRGACPR